MSRRPPSRGRAVTAALAALTVLFAVLLGAHPLTGWSAAGALLAGSLTFLVHRVAPAGRRR